jgi:hypothetical protein
VPQEKERGASIALGVPKDAERNLDPVIPVVVECPTVKIDRFLGSHDLQPLTATAR